ncbi:MAG: adenine-specific methyltransferase EcoRI family protein [Thermoguttaceae bacterium]|nr:adenine-specific methyltransferase EcoRI family protein [Thermoguttaceae bacterium]
MPNENLQAAKKAKNDEFYTQYPDIQKEVNAYLEFDPDVFRGKTILCPCDDPEWSNFTKFFAQNFEFFGLKKLISTSYAIESKNNMMLSWNPTDFETGSPEYDTDRSKRNGKIFVLDHDTNQNGKIDIDDLEWKYMDMDGDFRSNEVTALREEADIIITNPPFSMFREFLAWIMKGKKKFLIIGSMNAITYKEVFPYIQENKMWLGNGFHKGNAFFKPLGDANSYAGGVYDPQTGLVKFRNCCWLTNLDHARRHEPLSLMTMEDNLKYSKHKELKGRSDYLHYDNYDAIEVPYTDAIPSDYSGVMGVPVSFLDKYCPEQFEIVGMISAPSDPQTLNLGKDYSKYIGYTQDGKPNGRTGSTFGKCPAIVMDDGIHPYYEKDGIRVQTTYHRIFIRHLNPKESKK